MKKKLLCGAIGLSLILGSLTGCGDMAKEISLSESTKETDLEPAKSTEKNNDVDGIFAKEDESEQKTGEGFGFSINKTISGSVTERLFNSSYKDLDELSWDDLIIDIEDAGKRWEWGYEDGCINILDMDKFGRYDCYSSFIRDESEKK